MRDEKSTGKRPDHLAYNNNKDKKGQSHYSRIGAGWSHKDEQGVDIQLDAVPVSGRITLRKIRADKMKDFQEQAQAQEKRAPEPERGNPDERSR